MTIAKYPSTLEAEIEDVQVDSGPIVVDYSTLVARLEKRRKLFYANTDPDDADPAHFSEHAWRTFVIRVAKFLAFVDRKRGARGMLESLSNEHLQLEFDAAEHDAGVFMDRASALQAEIERRRR